MFILTNISPAAFTLPIESRLVFKLFTSEVFPEVDSLDLVEPCSLSAIPILTDEEVVLPILREPVDPPPPELILPLPEPVDKLALPVDVSPDELTFKLTELVFPTPEPVVLIDTLGAPNVDGEDAVFFMLAVYNP